MKTNRGMRTGTVTLISLAMLLGATAFATAQTNGQTPQANGAPGYGPGYGSGPGMMGQGHGYGMMGPGYGPGQAAGPGTGYGMGRGYGMGPGFGGGPNYSYGPGYGMRPDFDARPGYGRRPGFGGAPGANRAPGYGRSQGFGRGPSSGRAPFTGTQIDASKVEPLVKDYLSSFSTGGAFEVAEIMQFQYNYYVQVRDKNSGALAFELLVNSYNGRVTPEPGPNMMWNTKYGHMASYNGNTAAAMTVSPNQAVKAATDYLKQYAGNGISVGKAEKFPGYYTLHVLDGGKITGMLSVNGYTGAVWYHNWHGPYEKMITERD